MTIDWQDKKGIFERIRKKSVGFVCTVSQLEIGFLFFRKILGNNFAIYFEKNRKMALVNDVTLFCVLTKGSKTYYYYIFQFKKNLINFLGSRLIFISFLSLQSK